MPLAACGRPNSVGACIAPVVVTGPVLCSTDHSGSWAVARLVSICLSVWQGYRHDRDGSVGMADESPFSLRHTQYIRSSPLRAHRRRLWSPLSLIAHGIMAVKPAKPAASEDSSEDETGGAAPPPSASPSVVPMPPPPPRSRVLKRPTGSNSHIEHFRYVLGPDAPSGVATAEHTRQQGGCKPCTMTNDRSFSPSC